MEYKFIHGASFALMALRAPATPDVLAPLAAPVALATLASSAVVLAVG